MWNLISSSKICYERQRMRVNASLSFNNLQLGTTKAFTQHLPCQGQNRHQKTNETIIPG